MKPESNQHTTNYFNTFIEVADDTRVSAAQIPTLRNGNKTVGCLQFEMLSKNPYKYTSDDILFRVYAERNDLMETEFETARAQFFSKGQACFRASPLTKQFGWGVHFDQNGKIALYGMESKEYGQFVHDPKINKVKAMRSSKK